MNGAACVLAVGFGSIGAACSPAVESPVLGASGEQCVPDDIGGCEMEAAESAGPGSSMTACSSIRTVAVRSGIVSRSGEVVFPADVAWSPTENGIVSRSGEVAGIGDRIYDGGGSPSGELGRLHLTARQRDELRRCAALSDNADGFWDMGAGSGIVRLDRPPDF